MMRARTRLSAWCAVVACTAGCALTSKSDPLTPRYYTPGLSEGSSHLAETSRASRGDSARQLRLGKISSASYLGERIVFRDSNDELGFYDERRWSEKPEVYLRRAMARKLFEQEGVSRLLSGNGPTLELELTDFEELRGAEPKARARATLILQDGRSVIREQTIAVERPIPRDAKNLVTADASVRALAEALDDLVQRVAALVVSDLSKLPAQGPNADSVTP